MLTADEILDAGHHCVVANPPYIVPPTPEARDAYRARYVSAHGKYGLGAPFTERLHQIVRNDGFVAQITSNAFMKREHGKRLIEEVLPRCNLTHVVDTGGAFIPGHGTPTVIMASTGGPPRGEKVLTVQSKRGESKTPEDGDAGEAWRSIEQALGLPATPRRAYGLEGLRILGEVTKTLRPLAKAKAPRLGEWVAAYALLLAFRSRGYLAEITTLRETVLRLDELLPQGEWLAGLAESPLSEEHEAAVRGAFAKARPPYVDTASFGPQRSGWASRDTDWIGDLYQGANDVIVKRDALCQTPWFVRDLLFVLALGPALRAHGGATTVLDPTCGTGHLLVGAFWQMFSWFTRDDEYTVYGAADRALSAVRGVELASSTADLARYRLALSWLDATGAGLARARPGEAALARVTEEIAPCVAVGDSLLAGRVRESPPERAPSAASVVAIKSMQLGLFSENDDQKGAA